MNSIRVVVADDDALVRRALARWLVADADMLVVGAAEDGAAAIEEVRLHQPDVVIMDVHMPRVDGVQATAEITRRWPETRVLAVTTFGTIESVLPMLRAGASGYLLKEAEPADIRMAVRDVHQGTVALSRPVTRLLITSTERSQPAQDAELSRSEHPTERERQVVEYLSQGMSNLEIADCMHLSEGTVKAHMSAVMAKWGARDRVQVLIRAARAQLIRF